ncbi:MAG TPA: hypothetical protein VLA69_01315 [Gaiellaceae bacterium]|nr:hypothetical protein [Gaiellaceae bacterium]
MISTRRTGAAFSRRRGSSLPTTGTVIEMNVAAALWTICGKGITVAASERSGSGTHIRTAIATTCRRGMSTTSAAPFVVELLVVPKVIIGPQNLRHTRSRHFAQWVLPRPGYLHPSSG